MYWRQAVYWLPNKPSAALFENIVSGVTPVQSVFNWSRTGLCYQKEMLWANSFSGLYYSFDLLFLNSQVRKFKSVWLVSCQQFLKCESAFVGQMNGLSLSPMLTLPRPCTIQEQHANSRWVRALIYNGDRLKGSQPYYWWIGHMASISNWAGEGVVCRMRPQGTFSLPLKSACG